jgi:imidazolonepropionase-like amidohydrolase
MTRAKSTVLVTIILLLLLTSCGPSTPPLVFRNGLVVTATGADPIPNGVVMVKNGLITAVGTESSVKVPKDAIVIDLEGKTLMPGLIDARASDLLRRLQLEDGQINAVPAEIFLRSPLEAGVTTFRATGWSWEEMQNTPGLKTALEELGNSIPTMVVAGASLAHSEGPAYKKYYPDQTVGVGTVEEARQKTEEIIELGAHQVNFLMSSGPSLNETLEERSPVLSLEMLTAIVETAHAQDTLVVGQALFPEEAMVAIDAGVDEITSWPSLTEPMPEELIQALISNSVTILSGFSVGAPQEGDVRRFLDAGGILVFGTFAPNSGANPVGEFRLMELHGMTPMEMIQSATVNAANVVGLGDVVGTLEVGKQADIIVLDGNLFEDGFVATIGKVVYVVNNGELVVQPEQSE